MAARCAPAIPLARILFVPLLLAAIGCAGPPGPGDGAAAGSGLTAGLLAELYQYEDRRTPVAERFDAFAADPDPAVRARAALALGRIGDPRSVPLIERLLEDVDPGVRSEAAFAAGLAGDPAIEPALRRRLADDDPQVRGMAIQALMRLDSGGGGLEALADELVARIGDSREADLDILLGNAWRLKGHPALQDLLIEWASRPDEAGGERRRLAIYSLARLGEPGAAGLFMRLLADGDPAVRALAARGLGAAGSAGGDPAAAGAALAGILVAEDHWLVRVEGFNALGRLGVAPDTEVLCKAMADEHPQVQTAAIRAAGAMTGVSDKALTWLAALLGAVEPGVAPDAAQALARLGDRRGLAWGLEASRSPEPLRRAEAAAVLAHVHAGDEARAALRMLLGEESGSVVRGALTALAGAGRVAEFHEDIARALIDGKGVLTRAAAAEALGASEDPAFSLPLLLAAERQESKQKAPDCRLSILGLLAGHRESAEAVQSVTRALEARDRLVRQRAAEVMAGWGRRAEVPPGVCEERGRPPLDLYRRAAALYHSRVDAHIDTGHGTVVIELFPREAPLTVLNFLDLASAGYFDGIRFHRVEPGFVVQGGDPEGDGWGGPGHVIRCENNRLPYQRGMVGMALSGKDTGGSQFFVTLAPQPHLDGRYTIFGRVAGGMEVVDRIRRGERISAVRIGISAAPP